MGAIWAHDVPGLFEAAGIPVSYYPGWEWRSRSSGGYDSVMAIGIHHDAVPAGRSVQARLDYAWVYAPAEPIGAMWIHTDGRVHFGAAGATNTQGTQLDSDPRIQTSKGLMPHKRGNYYTFSIEMSNNGLGEVWTWAQLQTLEKVLVILCKYYNLDPMSDIVSHWRYTARKNDPRGPTPSHPSWGGTSGLNEWNDTNVGTTIARLSAPPPPPVPPTTPPQIPSEEDMATQVINKRLYDSRPKTAYSGSKTAADTTVTLNAGLPAGTRTCKIRLTTVESNGPGWAVLWGKGGKPQSSSHNQVPGQAVGSSTDVALEDDGSFHAYFSVPTHIIFDINSYEVRSSALQG